MSDEQITLLPQCEHVHPERGRCSLAAGHPVGPWYDFFSDSGHLYHLETCGCLKNDAGAHAGDCPEYRTIERYEAGERVLSWVRREVNEDE